MTVKGKGGQPRWIPPDKEKVEALAARGLTKEQIAHSLGISYNCLNETTKRDKEFNEAIKRGQAKGISIISNALFENAKNGNTTSQIFYLKTRAGWTEKVEHHHTHEDIDRKSEELKKRYEKHEKPF